MVRAVICLRCCKVDTKQVSRHHSLPLPSKSSMLQFARPPMPQSVIYIMTHCARQIFFLFCLLPVKDVWIKLTVLDVSFPSLGDPVSASTIPCTKSYCKVGSEQIKASFKEGKAEDEKRMTIQEMSSSNPKVRDLPPKKRTHQRNIFYLSLFRPHLF